MADKSKLTRLLALKCAERPLPGYLEEVEIEFHQRLSTEFLKREQRFGAKLWSQAEDFVSSLWWSWSAPLKFTGALAALVLSAYLGYQSHALFHTSTQDSFTAVRVPAASQTSTSAQATRSTRTRQTDVLSFDFATQLPAPAVMDAALEAPPATYKTASIVF